MIKIKSYNAVRAEYFGKKLTWADKLILKRSYPHTHTEVQLSEKYGGISFSSTMRDGLDGCRFMQIEYDPKRWDTVEIPCTELGEERIYRAAQSLETQKIGYDFVGLMSFGTKWEIILPNTTKMWCSEAVLSVVLNGIELSDEVAKILVPDKTHPAMCDTILRYWFSQH